MKRQKAKGFPELEKAFVKWFSQSQQENVPKGGIVTKDKEVPRGPFHVRSDISHPCYKQSWSFYRTNTNILQLTSQIKYYTISHTKVKNIDEVKDTLNKNYETRVEKKPALNAYWIQKGHSYYKYQPYYSEVAKEENELFISANKGFLENLQFLLQCTYHQFWNYVIFEPRLKTILRSYLLNPVHIYELKYLEGEYLTFYDDIYNKVAMIYLRMLTCKESNVEFMSEETLLKLLDTNKIINYIDIMNLLMLYNKTNPKLINQIDHLFFSDKQKTKYTKELVKILNHFLLIFDMVGGQICGFEQNSVVIPIGIRSKPSVFDPYWLEEVVTYLLDTAATLNSLLSYCPPAIESAFSLGLAYRLTYFYNRIYPALYEMMHDRSNLPPNWPSIKARILDHIAMSRNEFVNAFHAIVTHFIDEIIQTLGDNEKQDACLERYISLISAALEDELFIFDYHHTHQIDLQLQTLADFHPQITRDHMRTNYILECLSTLPTLEKLKEQKIEKKAELNFTLPTTVQETSSLNEENQKHTYTESEILDLTKAVADTLPHLGDGFIRECLISYNYNTSEVISAILDERLPLRLDALPRDLIYVPPEPAPEQPTLAYTGKRPDYKDATQLLNDKSELEDVKKFVLKVSNVSYDPYDDEYDDRYDDEPVLRFYDKTDESSMYEHMGKRFEGYELVSDPSESSSEEEQDEAAAAKPKNAFCEDPAVLRAKREANRGGRGRSNDVVGKPKGQGQDKNVLHNREKKNVHKSSRANHNRKGGAQWKRNKGMIPS
ncbi:hypothetical protein MML48_8g00002497 [Holotrichia oblita]|uniref:Uncharacterized protein n=1 Tax=Holotrichia oblita TaxID=644536 RepID=A0ACB9SP54_HOLOL|nr:hypothetical protein MML48_8g00002497 [Holotrichia oblita]